MKKKWSEIFYKKKFEKVISKKSRLISNTIFEKLVNVNRLKRYRILGILDKNMKTIKLPPLNKHHKEKCASEEAHE